MIGVPETFVRKCACGKIVYAAGKCKECYHKVMKALMTAQGRRMLL